MRKLVDELVEADFTNFQVWRFIMDEALEDGDEIVEPVLSWNETTLNNIILIKTEFLDAKNQDFSGFIYWYPDENISSTQPVMYLDNKKRIYFWNGISRPTSEIDNNFENIKRVKLPVKFKTVENATLTQISGVLEGVYYFDELYTIKVFPPPEL